MLYGSELGDELTSENLPYTYDGGHLSEYGTKATAKRPITVLPSDKTVV